MFWPNLVFDISRHTHATRFQEHGIPVNESKPRILSKYLTINVGEVEGAAKFTVR